MARDLYEVLGVPRNANESAIKRAYRRLALRYHPDKNKEPDAEQRFKEISEAYVVLSDKSKRAHYDRYGEDGLRHAEENEATTSSTSFTFTIDPRATFTQFFGSIDPFGFFGPSSAELSNMFQNAFFMSWDDSPINEPTYHPPRSRARHASRSNLQADNIKDAPIERDLHVTLEEIDQGCSKVLYITHLVLVDTKHHSEKKKLIVNVKPGWKEGTRVIFENEGDQNLGHIPADLIYTLRELPHALFQREDSNLMYTANITLRQALLGTVISVPTLGEQRISVNTEKEIITPETVKVLSQRGLPKTDDPKKRGDLIIKFKIEFPKALKNGARRAICDYLPK